MDLASVIGLVVAIGMILAGNAIERGKIAAIAQPTAAMIVIGGTVGATMLQFPLATFLRAMKSIRAVFFAPASRDAKLVEEIVSYAATARRDGILALEPLAPKASDPFLVRALMMAIDGADSNAIRDALEQAIHKEEEEGEDAAKVFETAGG